MSKPDQTLLSLPGHAENSTEYCRILDWLADNSRQYAEQPALGGISNHYLSHAGLYQCISSNSTALLNAGFGRGMVILVALPNGPAALTAILSATAVTIALPITPEEPLDRIESLLHELPVRAVVFDANRPANWPQLCTQHQLIPLTIDQSVTHGAEARFEISVPAHSKTPAEPTRVDDTAILTMTAGTTSEPRIIAWSQASLYRSADAFANWAELESSDRSLCVMTFAHLHSLVRSCLPVLLRGGSVICAPGFDKIHFFDWIDEYQPTFLTAVPAIFRTMLTRAEDTGKSLSGSSLRFVATGSDRMDFETACKLKESLEVQIREFYGMSEVAPMLAATQPGQQAQIDGAIGSLLDDWQMEIRDENGDVLPTGQTGEIAVRGGLLNPVIAGRHNSDATGWYLTGDQGFLDDHGLLHLTGRSDERINRGGEKVVPQAVENVLATSPLVDQCVVLGLPDTVLGERVVALVVLTPDVEGDEIELRVHCARHLPDYMVPEQIRFVDEISSSRTGKISRRELAKQFINSTPGPDTTSEYTVLPGRFAPASPTETQLAALFTELLEIQPEELDSGYLDLETGFMEFGGDSFQAVCLLTRIEDQFGLLLSPADLIANGSVAALSRLIDEHDTGKEEILVQIQESVSGVPLIFTHAPMGYAFYAHTFAKYLGREIGVYACQWRQNMPDIAAYSMEEHARQYVTAIRDQLSGPYALAGHSFGAHLAYEIAQQLTKAGEQVVFLALIDDEADLFKRRYGIIHHPPESNSVYARSRWLLGKYVPRPYKGKVDLFLAEDGVMPEAFADPLVGWGDLAQGRITRHLVPGDHFSMMSEKHIANWSGLLKQRLAKASEEQSGYSVETTENEQAYQNTLRDTENARLAAIAGNLKQEIVEYQSALKKTEDQPYWVYRNFGLALLQLGRPRVGLEMLRRAVAREAVPLPGLILLADILKQLKRIKLSQAVISEAERIAPTGTHAQLLMGELHSRHDSLQKAETCFRSVLKQQPKFPRALIGLAKVLMRLNRQDEAVSLVFQAANLRPSDTGIRLLLAQLLVDVGENTAAEKILHELLATDPGHPVAQRLIAKLKAD